jgi:hypothetical protein
MLCDVKIRSKTAHFGFCCDQRSWLGKISLPHDEPRLQNRKYPNIKEVVDASAMSKVVLRWNCPFSSHCDLVTSKKVAVGVPKGIGYCHPMIHSELGFARS